MNSGIVIKAIEKAVLLLEIAADSVVLVEPVDEKEISELQEKNKRLESRLGVLTEENKELREEVTELKCCRFSDLIDCEKDNDNLAEENTELKKQLEELRGQKGRKIVGVHTNVVTSAYPSLQGKFPEAEQPAVDQPVVLDPTSDVELLDSIRTKSENAWDGGEWEVFERVEDGAVLGYQVRWSKSDEHGYYFWAGHYITSPTLSLGWCKNAAEKQAAKWNEEKRKPRFYELRRDPAQRIDSPLRAMVGDTLCADCGRAFTEENPPSGSPNEKKVHLHGCGESKNV